MARVSAPERDSAVMPPDAITVRAIREQERLAPLRQRWNELLQRSDTPTAELSYEWQTNHWKYFHGDDELFVLVAEDSGRVVGIAPLKRQKIRVNGMALHRLCFIAASESNYQDFITSDRSGMVHARFWQYLRDHRGDWDRLDLENVPTASTTIGHFPGERPERMLRFLRKKTRCLRLTIDRSWDEYLASRPRMHRANLRKGMRKLEEAGPVFFSRVTMEPQILRAMDGMIEFHRTRWNSTPTPSKFNDERMRSFYRDCLVSMSELGLMRLYALSAGNVLSALLAVFTMERTCVLQLGAFNARFERAGPSTLLIGESLKELSQQGFTTVDFGKWYEYKRVWTEEEHEKVTFEVYAGRRLRHLYCYATTALLMGVRESLKRVKWLRSAIQRLRQIVSRRPKRVDPDAGAVSE